MISNKYYNISQQNFDNNSYEESLSEGVENNISIKTNDSKEDNTGRAGIVLCQICYEKKIDCIFLPCGHVIQVSRTLVSLVLIAGKESLQHLLAMQLK